MRTPKEVNAEYAQPLLQDASGSNTDGDAVRAASVAQAKRGGPTDEAVVTFARAGDADIVAVSSSGSLSPQRVFTIQGQA